MKHDTDDIVRRLKDLMATQAGDVDGLVSKWRVLDDAIEHIMWLRSMVGAVSDGECHAELKARLPASERCDAEDDG